MGYISEKYIIDGQGNAGDLEAFVNDNGQLFVGDEHGYTFWVMEKDEWELFKKFIDAQFPAG